MAEAQAQGPPDEEFQRKVVYERGGIFVHVETPDGDNTPVPGRLLLEEVNAEAHVDWSPVKTTDCADDDQGWALIRQTSKYEIDGEYLHLQISFKLADVLGVTRTEGVMELPRMMFQFCDERSVTALYFHSASPNEFWQCLNRYLILARSPSDPNKYQVEGRTDALAKSLHGLNFSAEESQGIVSSFFSTGVEVLGGFSRVTQFMRSQLGGQNAATEVEEMDEVSASEVGGVLLGDEHRSAESVSGPASVTCSPESSMTSASPTASLLPVSSVRPVACAAGSLKDSVLPTAIATPSLATGDLDNIAISSVGQSLDQTASTSEAVVLTEPTGSLTSQSVRSSVDSAQTETAVMVSSNDGDDDLPDLMFQSASCELPVDEPRGEETAADPPAWMGMPSLRSEPGATLVDLDGCLAREEPLSIAEWKQYLDTDGHVHNVDRLRRRIFKGGLTREARPIVWKFLLHYHDLNSSHQEREQKTATRRERYFALQQQWQTMFPEQLKRFTYMERRLEIIGKDVVRTDRTHPKFADENGPYLRSLESILRSYAMYNFNLGYVQGMSDLLSPILAVMDDEVDAFWCFAGLMDMLEENFSEDMRGMRLQLELLLSLLQFVDPHLVEHFKKVGSDNMFFCFRWLLVLFKREFHFEEVMRLWEVLWSRYLSPHFELFLATAILTQQRQIILSKKMDSNDVITHVNSLAEEMDLDMMIIEAERICRELLSKPLSTIPTELRVLLPPSGVLGEQDSSV